MKASEPTCARRQAFRGVDTLWEDPEFERLTRQRGAAHRLERALQTAAALRPGTPLLFDLRPTLQEEILDQLAEERDGRGRYRNLVVAATGTGKTMLAGFDYARQPDRPNLLFLAHREELLRQARTSFRHILRDGSFGELLTGSERPARATHLFATIQSFARSDSPAARTQTTGSTSSSTRPSRAGGFVPGRSGSTAATDPAGLTATPERADNQSLLPDFDGRSPPRCGCGTPWRAAVVAVRVLRHRRRDGFSAIEWRQGGYDTRQIENLLTGNDRRAELIAEQFRRYREPGARRARWRSA
jgi:hypothetical protein